MTSILPLGQNRIVKSLIRGYYERAELYLPFDMELREFAFQPLSGGSYVRHLSFGTAQELREMLLREVPGHVFYSSAKYQRPSARDMEEKGWMGSDLQFDLDADHLCEPRRMTFCPVCGREVMGERCPDHDVEAREYMEISVECLKRTWDQAVLLSRILKEDFDMKPRIFFSGNRGFHVLVECSGDCALMDSEDRKEIVRYVMRDQVPFRGVEGDPGWAGRQEGGVEVDEQVTVDVHRLVRIPGSIHGKSSLMVKEMNEFLYDISLSPFSGKAVLLPFITGDFLLVDRQFHLNKGEPISMEAGYAVFAYLKGLGEVTYYVR
ncbi:MULTISPECIES: DNA primase small subunit PriS [Metallosphaera]|uniref:DNA primase small subunit PriS n=1 Tax=Metallosphaera TaxID=41980 RepID=UPI001EE08A5A|nr:DNA primase small subunit PriS [Metallosphaera javensis (ex Hofmann et al. 2022)]